MAVQDPSGQPKAMQPGEFASTSVPNRVSFQVDKIPPPSALYVQRDDTLVVQIISGINSEQYNLTARLLLAEGRVITIQRSLFSTTNYIVQQFNIPLAEGFLLSVAVSVTQASTRGGSFCSFFIARGGVTSAFVTLGLAADYVTVRDIVSWPGGRIIHPTEGPGNDKVYTVGNPAGATDWSLTVQNGARWRIQSASARFVTSAVVANRVPKFQVTNVINTFPLYTAPPNQVQAASLTAQLSAGPQGSAAAPETTTITQSIPDNLILSGLNPISIGSLTTNIQAGDQYSNIQVLVEEWLDY